MPPQPLHAAREAGEARDGVLDHSCGVWGAGAGPVVLPRARGAGMAGGAAECLPGGRLLAPENEQGVPEGHPGGLTGVRGLKA